MEPRGEKWSPVGQLPGPVGGDFSSYVGWNMGIGRLSFSRKSCFIPTWDSTFRGLLHHQLLVFLAFGAKTCPISWFYSLYLNLDTLHVSIWLPVCIILLKSWICCRLLSFLWIFASYAYFPLILLVSLWGQKVFSLLCWTRQLQIPSHLVPLLCLEVAPAWATNETFTINHLHHWIINIVLHSMNRH